MIKQEGLNWERISVFAGPAGGPKWFVSVGFDRALMKSRVLENNTRRVLLVGSSAGGWRCLTMACKDPQEAYEKLRIAYSRNVFSAADTPATLSQALARNVRDFISDEDIPFILEHRNYDLAIHTVRSIGPAASRNKTIEGLAVMSAWLGHLISPSLSGMLYERTVFYSGASQPEFLRCSFRGRAERLTSDNLPLVGLATGSLPYIIGGVPNIPGARTGVFRDGGLLDYQLNQDYCPGPESLTLFFHYQERIVPGWFDKHLKWRNPPRGSLDRVLQVFPGDDFVGLLPDGRLPDRRDFIDFADNPSERIRRWDEISRLSEILGEEFFEAVESKKIRELVEPL